MSTSASKTEHLFYRTPPNGCLFLEEISKKFQNLEEERVLKYFDEHHYEHHY